MKRELSLLGFDNERLFGKSLYECMPARNVVVFVEDSMRFPNKKWHLLIYDYEAARCRSEFLLDTLLEAKVILQDYLLTRGGNDGTHICP